MPNSHEPIHTVDFIDDSSKLETITKMAGSAPALALDIETINWWDSRAERVALVQLAFRQDGIMRAVIIDTLAGLDLEPLRTPLEMSSTTKAIHNAGYDAVRMARHFAISTSPIHDTMLAARRSGDKKWSLKAQAETHLGLHMDKTEQRSDWGRRPLSREQLGYAAFDPVCTLLLYERQIELGLRGDYQLRAVNNTEPPENRDRQDALPFNFTPAPEDRTELEDSAFALLGIVTELSGRFIPEQLAVSVGSERIGLAGWIIDRTLGIDADIDEDTAKQEIARLIERNFIRVGDSRRLEATDAGANLWKRGR